MGHGGLPAVLDVSEQAPLLCLRCKQCQTLELCWLQQVILQPSCLCCCRWWPRASGLTFCSRASYMCANLRCCRCRPWTAEANKQLPSFLQLLHLLPALRQTAARGIELTTLRCCRWWRWTIRSVGVYLKICPSSETAGGGTEL